MSSHKTAHIYGGTVEVVSHTNGNPDLHMWQLKVTDTTRDTTVILHMSEDEFNAVAHVVTLAALQTPASTKAIHRALLEG